MLWYKAWRETRSRFLIGLALLMILAGGTVFDYLGSKQFLIQAQTMEASGPFRELIHESMEIQRDYRGFVWFQWFRQNLAQLGTLFAVLLGSGSLLSYGSRDGVLFTLSLPVSRQ